MSVESRTKNVHNDGMKDDALVQFKLMLPAGLKRRVEDAARSSRRSLSQEIVATLEREFPAPTKPNLDEVIGHAALLELFNAQAEDRPNMVLALNERLEKAGSAERLTLHKGRIKPVVIGDHWSPGMALD